MPWSERQRAMLRAMGLHVWQPLARAQAAVEPTAATAAGAAPAAAAATREPPPGPSERTAPGAALAGREDFPSQLPPPSPPSPRSQVQPAPRASTAPPVPPVPPVPPEVPAAAGLDWTALRAAVAACQACPLAATRRQTVFGVGHEHAHWMVIGEAPGQQEDEQGEPFVGAAGQLLDAMLRSIGLTREATGDPARRVFIANTLKCRPPGNRNPAPAELAACEGFLVRQIQLVQPRILLAMGRFAVQALLRSGEPVGKLRGRVHHYQGVPLVVTYHPAYLLRNLPDKARAWEDLCLAAATAEAAQAAGSGEARLGAPPPSAA